ncbi:S-adenosyl-L-methionine-dependent methyltransferase [Aspergillus desertorum]
MGSISPLTPVKGPGLLSLLEDIRSAARNDTNPSQSPEGHHHLLTLIDKLRLAAETPTETARRLMYQPTQNAAIRTLVDLGVFELLAEAGVNGSGLSASQVSAQTNAERGLIVRLMRIATSLGLCDCDPDAAEPRTYRANSKTEVMTKPLGRDGLRCLYDLTMPTLSVLPSYFAQHAYRTPTNYAASPMRWATGQSQFEWLAERPEQQARFNAYMRSRREGHARWFSVYPVETLLRSFKVAPSGEEDRDGTVFMVDVGGNEGYDLLWLRGRYPDFKGRLLLQDLPAVVARKDIQLERKGIEVTAYSFFEVQPVKGAAIYYFRSIFHDWPDSVCLQILRNTIPAMGPDSRILIVDFVLPDTDTPLFQASLDIQMMCIGSAVERSRSEWEELLGMVGLEIRGVWSMSPAQESVIEVGRADDVVGHEI